MKTNAHRSLGLFAALAVVMLAAYWRVLHFPFIQDDWGWLARFQAETPGTVLTSIFAFKGKLFYRPLAELYLFLMYHVFGAHALPFHIAALLLHFASACLAIAITRIVTADETISYATGFIYVVAVAVFQDSLLWAVGIYDLGGVFFFLLAMLLFVKDRPKACAVVYLAGCLFKETVVILPIILLAYTRIVLPWSRMPLRDAIRRRFLPMVIGLGVVIITKVMGRLPSELPPSHPYAVSFFGFHVLRALFRYACTMLQCLDPFLAMHGQTIRVLLLVVILCILMSAWLVSRKPRNEAVARAFWLFLVWFFVALLPVLFLKSHSYRYYAIYSTSAFIALILTQERVLGTAVGLSDRYNRAQLIAVTCVVVLLSVGRARQMLGEGLSPRTLVEGTNSLIRRAATVEVVRDGLKKLLPSPPHEAVIILGNVDIWAFNKDSGPRVWYGDPSLRVYAVESLKYDFGGPYIERPAETQGQTYAGTGVEKLPLDKAKLFVFRFDGANLRPVVVTVKRSS